MNQKEFELKCSTCTDAQNDKRTKRLICLRTWNGTNNPYNCSISTCELNEKLELEEDLSLHTRNKKKYRSTEDIR